MDWSIEDILRFFREPPPPDWKYREEGLIHRGIDRSLENMIPVAEEQAKRIALAEMETQKARQERSDRLSEGWATEDAALREASGVAPSVKDFVGSVNDFQTELGHNLYEMITGRSDVPPWEQPGYKNYYDARPDDERINVSRADAQRSAPVLVRDGEMIRDEESQRVAGKRPGDITIEIGGLEYDPYKEKIGLGANANLEKIAAIKAEGKIKSAMGDLKFDAKQHPQYEELKAAYLQNLQAGDLGGGSFVHAADSPELRQREMDRDFWLAASGNRLARLMMSQQETMDDPESMVAAESLRKQSAEELESVRMQHGLTLLEAAKDESGLISPTAAWNYEQIMGEPVPDQLRGLDEWGARQEIFKLRSRVEANAAMMAQGGGGMMNVGAYRASAIAAIAEAQRKLDMGQNPNIVISQLMGKLAIAEGGGGLQQQPATQAQTSAPLSAYNAGGQWSHAQQ